MVRADLIVPMREVLTAVVFIAVAIIVTARARTAPPIRRAIYWPIAFVALLRAFEYAAYVAIRRGDPTSGLLDVLMWA